MKANEIVTIFGECFGRAYRTKLVGGASEPVYQPANSERDYHEIHFREDFETSALHEIAHWCTAGKHRRTLTDFGYWYEGERDLAAQKAFEEVEAWPQSLEWMFSEAAGVSFRVSADNFDESAVDRKGFARKVRKSVLVRLDTGLGPRADRFVKALIGVTGNVHAFNCSTYRRLPV